METKQLEDLLNTLADKLSIPINYLWEVMANGKQMEGIIEFASYSVSAFLLILAAYITYKVSKREIDEYSKEGDKSNEEKGKKKTNVIVFNAIIGILSWMAVYIMISAISSSLLKIMAPEYSVIIDFLSLYGTK